MDKDSEFQSQITKLGNQMVDGFHLLGLFVIGAAIIWASWAEVFNIIAEHDHPTIKDILLQRFTRRVSVLRLSPPPEGHPLRRQGTGGSEHSASNNRTR